MIPKDVKDICELFDCGVCTDMGICGRPPKNEDAYPKGLRPCYYIGATPEPAACLSGFRLTPSFFTEAALQRYCNSRKGRDAINKLAGETFTDWNTETQDWNNC